MADKKKILIAEDEKPLANALFLKLSKLGFEVVIANNGNDAVTNLKTNDFDLALMDMVMPGKEGFTVLAEVKDDKLKTQIIVLSNLAQEEDMAKAKSLGAKEYFVKSNTPISQIVEYVEKSLE